jgi:hypothetical protein
MHLSLNTLFSICTEKVSSNATEVSIGNYPRYLWNNSEISMKWLAEKREALKIILSKEENDVLFLVFCKWTSKYEV